MVHTLRVLLRWLQGRTDQPTAAILASRTLPSTPESGHRAGYDGAKRKRGSKVHLAVDTLGHVSALRMTPADAQDRAQVGPLLAEVQELTRQTVEVAYVDQGYTGQTPADEAAEQGICLEVVKLAAAKRGFVLLPGRWVVERDFGWLSRFRRFACDQERLADMLQGFHLLAFIMLMCKQVLPILIVL